MQDIVLWQTTLARVNVMEAQCLHVGSRPPFTADIWAHYHATPRGIVVTKVAMGKVLLGEFLVSLVKLKIVVPHFI
jgi:hypothetical protein